MGIYRKERFLGGLNAQENLVELEQREGQPSCFICCGGGTMNATLETEVRRRILKRDAVKGILMLAVIELIRTLPLLISGSAKRVGLSPVSNAMDFVVSFVIGLVLGTVFTNRYLKVEGQRLKVIKVSATWLNWSGGILVGVCTMLGSIGFDTCLHFLRDDLMTVFH